MVLCLFNILFRVTPLSSLENLPQTALKLTQQCSGMYCLLKVHMILSLRILVGKILEKKIYSAIVKTFLLMNQKLNKIINCLWYFCKKSSL